MLPTTTGCNPRFQGQGQSFSQDQSRSYSRPHSAGAPLPYDSAFHSGYPESAQRTAFLTEPTTQNLVQQDAHHAEALQISSPSYAATQSNVSPHFSSPTPVLDPRSAPEDTGALGWSQASDQQYLEHVEPMQMCPQHQSVQWQHPSNVFPYESLMVLPDDDASASIPMRGSWYSAQPGQSLGDLAASPYSHGSDSPKTSLDHVFDDPYDAGSEVEAQSHDLDFVADSDEGADIQTVGMPKKKKKSKMHECDVCKKLFPRPSGLRTHMNTHLNLKPFKCEFEGCNRHFTVRSNARRHLRTHGVVPQPSNSSPPPYKISFESTPSPFTAQDIPDLPIPTRELKWVPQSLNVFNNTGSLGASCDIHEDADSDELQEDDPMIEQATSQMTMPLTPTLPTFEDEGMTGHYEEQSPYLNSHSYRHHPQFRVSPGSAIPRSMNMNVIPLSYLPSPNAIARGLFI